MSRRRIVINLAFFALLGVALAVWAVRSIITVDAIERPFHVTADFADSPGLNPDLEVTHLGVRVGTVGDVKLRQGHVAVRLDLDRGVRVPAGAGARVLRKSAIGEPYIELTPPSRPGAAVLEEGDRIPAGRTVSTVDYRELFTGLSTTLRSVDPRDARTLVHETATGLRGRGESINAILGDTHQLTGTLAAGAGTLDAVSVELTRLAGTLSGHRGQLASGINDLASVTESLRKNRKNLDAILEHGPVALREVNRLLETSRPGLGCLLTAAAAPTQPLLTPANSARIRHVLRMVPTLNALVTDVTGYDSGGRYLRVAPVISVAGTPAPAEYTSPVPRPKAPGLNLCPGTPKAAKSTSRSQRETRQQQPTPVEASPAGRVDGTLPARPAGAEGEGSSPAGRWLPLLPPAIAAAILIATAARAVRVRFQK